ncbi:MAG: GNAT family N-acetyltransferase [Bacteroidales bacterium]|jgi:hypothetical protein|nr:GNAT family N-acetyltransferase [Bacteroidales bacterium]
MKPIIPPVPVETIYSELTQDRFFRKTNNGNNEIYIISDQDSPNVMQEIGRLREITFRDSGGGTGKPTDIDDFDRGPYGFKQLIVWNPEDKAIMGGYRFVDCKNLPIDDHGKVQTPAAKLFHYSDQFIKEFIPKTIELGRSFVQPFYQPMNNIRKGIFALDNLWDGLGSLIQEYPHSKYFFGKVTMYPHYDKFARDLILYFLNRFFPDPDKLVYPYNPMPYHHSLSELEKVFTGKNYEENYKILVQKVRERKHNIPPLVNAYMNLSSTMRTFGTALNTSFGEVEETGIILTIDDIYGIKKDRHLHFEKGEKPVHLL